MEDLKLVEKVVIVPENPTNRRRIFLSNIDLALVVYQETVAFFDPPTNNLSFSEACNNLYRALGSLLVAYDFFAGRLVQSLEDDRRFEIDCNGAGIVVATAKTETCLSKLGQLFAPKPEFRHLVSCLHEANEEEKELQDKPLLFIQFTQFGCGSLALASRYNHCVMDGIAVREFEQNLAALTRGDDMKIIPNPDRILFKARNPPRISHQHLEYSKACEEDTLFTECGRTSFNSRYLKNEAKVIHLSPLHIASLKKAVLMEGKLKNCSIFQLVAAKIWKARTIATKMEDEINSMMLFPVNVRKLMVPPAPNGFAGNASVPGFAKASVKELKNAKSSEIVRLVQQGMERLNDEYVRSGIDWLEVHRGVPCRENSFSLVAWFRLGLEDENFLWGKSIAAAPIVSRPGLVFLLPGAESEGGLNICIGLPGDQAEEFERIVLEP